MKNGLKERFNIRLFLLFYVLPISIIPIIIVTIYSTGNINKYLRDLNKTNYSNILNQIALNIDSVYQNYAISLSNIASSQVFIERVNYTYKNYDDEIKNSISSSLLRPTSIASMSGVLLFYELDKKSFRYDSDYKVHYSAGGNFIVPDLTELLTDPLYLKLKNDNSIKMIIGKFTNNVLKTELGSKESVIIYPYYPVSNEIDPDVKFSKFFLNILYEDFFTQFYNNIENFKMGTLYILDRNNNVLAYNHPGNEDYYAYDDKTGKYILGEDDPNDPYEIMSFDDYKLLNTDKNILLEDKVRDVLQTLNSVDSAYENEYYVLNYNNIDYVFYYDYAKLSETKLLYFFPLNQIYKPIYKIRNIIYLISIVIILFVSVISFWMSAFFIKPLKTLLNRALEVSNGNYKSSINTDKFYGEFFTLGKSFNFMTNTIDNYSENLENLVEKRNSELIKINKDLADVNDKMKSELVMAQNIQKAIIPKYFPSEDMIKVTGSYIPMEELGGDYYDVFKISQNKVGILIVDVSGHGVPAALITAMAKVSFIYYSTENRNTAQIVKLVNDELYKIIGNMEYLTAFFGIIDLKEGILEYTNAGHTDILILDDKLSFTYLQTNSFFIGLSDKADFISSFVKLAPKYKLFLYTDGLIEAKNGENELYSLERFKKVILNNQNLQIKDIKENIIEDMYNFKGNHFLDDDITLLIIQIAGKYDKINIEYQ